MDNNTIIHSPENNVAIDAMKFVCALLVLMSHCSPLGFYAAELNYYLVNLSFRFAVPFFFICSGYFFFKKGATLLPYIKRILSLYFIWTMIYILFQLPYEITLAKIRDFLFYGSFFHFWYFPSLIVSLIFVVLLAKILDIRIIIAISAVLYLFGSMGDMYGNLFAHAPVVGKWLLVYRNFAPTRDGIFFPSIFISLGAYFAKKPPNERNKKYLLFGLGVSFLFFVFEFILGTQKGWMVDRNMPVFIVPVASFLFALCLMVKGGDAKTGVFLRRMSTVIYCSHILVALYVSEHLHINNQIVIFLLILGITLALSVLIVLKSKRLPGLRKLY